MSDLERTVAEVRAALAKATKGPWKAEGPSFGYFTVRQDPVDWNGQGYQQVCGMPSLTKHSAWRATFQANADLIAHAPSWLSALCDGVEAMQRERDALQNDLMTCVAPVEVGGGIVNWTIDQLRERVSTLEADRDAAYARGLEAAKQECDFLRAGLTSDAEYFGFNDEDEPQADEATRAEYLGKANIAKLCMDRIDALAAIRAGGQEAPHV